MIVLKDIKHDDLEALMNYMYVGEVNVLQERLAGLIKAAECLKIKGLAVPDEDPLTAKDKRNQARGDFESPHAKRRRREDVSFEDRHISSRGSRLSHHREHPPSSNVTPHVENLPPETTTVEPGLSDPLSEASGQGMESEPEHMDGDPEAESETKHKGNSGASSNQRSSSHHKPIPEVSIFCIQFVVCLSMLCKLNFSLKLIIFQMHFILFQ